MTVFDKNMVATASFLAAITIAIGAFGAHGLKQIVDASALNTFETGVRYQMYHCLAILLLGLARSREAIGQNCTHFGSGCRANTWRWQTLTATTARRDARLQRGRRPYLE